jgi:hypothetical protein
MLSILLFILSLWLVASVVITGFASLFLRGGDASASDGEGRPATRPVSVPNR